MAHVDWYMLLLNLASALEPSPKKMLADFGAVIFKSSGEYFGTALNPKR